jgi:uncharacterized cupredoxin-like copper-binding protein
MLRSRLILPLTVAALVAAAVPAILQARTGTASITVTVGVPKELSLKVTPKKVTASPAVFNVTNKGKLPHSFKVCTKPSTTDKANTCTGVATKSLAPGKSQKLTVKLAKSGTYEYLSGKASEAASGMKGLLTVALAPASSASNSSPTTSTPTTTAPATTTTTKTSPGTTTSGGVVNGQATDPSCPAGTLVPVGPGAGDQDDDNEGGFPSDGDGCL